MSRGILPVVNGWLVSPSGEWGADGKRLVVLTCKTCGYVLPTKPSTKNYKRMARCKNCEGAVDVPALLHVPHQPDTYTSNAGRVCRLRRVPNTYGMEKREPYTIREDKVEMLVEAVRGKFRFHPDYLPGMIPGLPLSVEELPRLLEYVETLPPATADPPFDPFNAGFVSDPPAQPSGMTPYTDALMAEADAILANDERGQPPCKPLAPSANERLRNESKSDLRNYAEGKYDLLSRCEFTGNVAMDPDFLVEPFLSAETPPRFYVRGEDNRVYHASFREYSQALRLLMDRLPGLFNPVPERRLRYFLETMLRRLSKQVDNGCGPEGPPREFDLNLLYERLAVFPDREEWAPATGAGALLESF